MGQGLFVAFEGGDGAGKSTQARALAAALEARGHEVVLTREPGGTPAAEAMRHVVLTPEYAGLDPRAEALLYAASRAEHVARLVLPALQRGAVVITDRYIDSSIAYQGVGRGLGPDVVGEINLWATRSLLPDLTVLLDVEAGAGLARLSTEPDRLESEPEEFHATRRGSIVDDWLFGRQAVHTKVFTVVDDLAPIDALDGPTASWLDDPFGLEA